MNGLEDLLYMTAPPLLSPKPAASPKRAHRDSRAIAEKPNKRQKSASAHAVVAPAPSVLPGIDLHDVVETLFSVQKSVSALQQSVDKVYATKARIENSVQETRAMQINMLKRIRNGRTREFTQPLEELVKERATTPPPRPTTSSETNNAAAAVAPAAGSPSAAGVGELPSARGIYFPTARGDAFTLTESELQALALFYGEDFDIGEADTLRCRQDKFLRFVCA